MKLDTTICFRFESVGRPKNTMQGSGSVHEVMLALTTWILSVYMGSKIRIILARDATELSDRRSAAPTDFAAELESILSAQEGDFPHDIGSGVAQPEEGKL